MRDGHGLLERAVSGVKNLGKSVKDGVTSKAYWVDTLTGSSFWMPMMTLNETVIREALYGEGSTWDEVGKARLVGVGISLCISRPISKFRDYWSKNVFKVDEGSSKLRKNGADLALAAAIVPGIYTLTLGLAGESLGEIGQMVPTGSAIQMAMGFAYVKYLDKTREVFGTTPDYLLREED